MSRPSDIERVQPGGQQAPVYDVALKWLAGHQHPQQRRQLLHSHQQKLKEFIDDTNAQWDSDDYVRSRFNPTLGTDGAFLTPEIRKNVDASTPEDGGLLPLSRKSQASDKLSVNELQLHLSNHAAALRMKMADEFEDMRMLQNRELKYFVKGKELKEPEFAKAVEGARQYLKKQASRPSIPRQNSSSSVPIPLPQPIPTPTTVPTTQIPAPTSQSTQPTFLSRMSPPPLLQSPAEPISSTAIRNDPVLPPIAQFLLQLDIVKQNWNLVAPNWNTHLHHYTEDHMSDLAFTKAVLNDAVRPQKDVKFPINTELVEKARDAEKRFPDHVPLAKLITKVILDMAEKGDIEFSEDNQEMGERNGYKILTNVIHLQQQVLEIAQQQNSGPVEKAKDPRQR